MRPGVLAVMSPGRDHRGRFIWHYGRETEQDKCLRDDRRGLYLYRNTVFQQPEGLSRRRMFLASSSSHHLPDRAPSRNSARQRWNWTIRKRRFIAEASKGTIHYCKIIPTNEMSAGVYLPKESGNSARTTNIPSGNRSFSRSQCPTPEFAPSILHVRGVREVEGYRVLVVKSAAIPNATCDSPYSRHHGNLPPFLTDRGESLKHLAHYIPGEGDIAPVTHEVLCKRNRISAKRPAARAR